MKGHFRQNENPADIEALILSCGDDILRICTVYLKDRDAAEDAFQEVFLKVFQSRARFEGRSDIKTWLIRIAINTCKDMLKSSWRRHTVPMDETAGAENAAAYLIEDDVLERQERRRVLEAVQELPVIYKDVVILHYYYGYALGEISKMLGMREASVRSRMFRAKALLRQRLYREETDSCEQRAQP